MKKCSKCQEIKIFSDFAKNKNKADGLQDYCKSCYKIYNANSYKNSENRRNKIAERNKSRIEKHRKIVQRHKRICGCLVCGEKEICVLDYHHLDPKIKEENIGNILTNSWETIKKEIRKCVVLCSNCHRKHHAGVLDRELEGLLAQK